jgi:type II secretory pathway pseudopilin PulG
MRGSSGYAIAEVLVACVIISISFVELSRAISNIMRSANQTVLMGKSISVAHSTMEEVMAQSFDTKGSEAGGYVLDFDGTDDYVDTGNSFQTTFDGSFTVSCWVKPDDGNPSQNKAVFGTANSSVEDRVVLEVGSTGIINCFYESDNNMIRAFTSSTVFADGPTVWTHVALVVPGTGSNLLIYINGNPVSVTISGGTIPEMSTWASSDEVFIGANDNDGTAESHFAGYIDEFRIWNDVRTAAEILASYNRSISDPYEESNLKLYLRMNNGSGSIAFDQSSSMAHGTLLNVPTWTSQSISWSTILGKETEASWSEYNDVDDFHTVPFTDTDYSQLGGRIYVKYVIVDPTSWAISDAGEGTTTDYKQITVKIGIPGSTDSTQLSAIKSAKIIQNYGLTYSPYGN